MNTSMTKFWIVCATITTFCVVIVVTLFLIRHSEPQHIDLGTPTYPALTQTISTQTIAIYPSDH